MARSFNLQLPHPRALDAAHVGSMRVQIRSVGVSPSNQQMPVSLWLVQARSRPIKFAIRNLLQYVRVASPHSRSCCRRSPTRRHSADPRSPARRSGPGLRRSTTRLARGSLQPMLATSCWRGTPPRPPGLRAGSARVRAFGLSGTQGMTALFGRQALKQCFSHAPDACSAAPPTTPA